MRVRLIAEFVGTFFIVFAPVAFATSGAAAGASLAASAAISGASVTLMVLLFSAISGAHLNPVVTFGLAMFGRFPRREVPHYVAAQLVGGVAAPLAVMMALGKVSGAHVPANSETHLLNVSTEAAITFVLMFTILAVTGSRRSSKFAASLAIGAAVFLGVIVGGETTGGSMNPTRSLGPNLLVSGAMSHYWVYVVGPFLGSGLAVLGYRIARGLISSNSFPVR